MVKETRQLLTIFTLIVGGATVLTYLDVTRLVARIVWNIGQAFIGVTA